MDSHQAIYEATRSRISNGNVGEAVADVARQAFDISHVVQRASEAVTSVEYEHIRPSVLFRPALSIDGNQWCALYGANLQDGVAGFGDSPDEAMRDFDGEWNKSLTIRTAP